jgi:hypothetical protein
MLARGFIPAVQEPFELLAGLDHVDEYQRDQIHFQLRDRGHQAGAALAGQCHCGRQQFGMKHTRRQHHPVGHQSLCKLLNQRYGLLDGGTGIRRPEELSRITFEINRIHSDDGVGSCGTGTLHGVDSHPAGADHDDGVAGLRSDADGARAPAGRDATRHQGGGLKGNRVVDLDH